jgi:glycosyltransferase involved in cell wall biosynthesis
VIPNVANVHLFKPASDKINQPLKFIHISSLNDREKNVSGLIRAFGRALETNPDLELSIVGEGVDKPKYEKLIHDLELSSKIKFRGRLLKEKLASEINASDALIMFSNYETFCLVIIEAFACGKPVITSNAGAIADYMSPKLGIMVHKRNEAELTEAINNFVNSVNAFDKKYIRDYAVENYSYEVVGRKLDDIYNSVLANKNKAQS